MQQTFLLLKKIVADKLTSNQKKFIAEVIGTFVVVVLATGAVVIDAKYKRRARPLSFLKLGQDSFFIITDTKPHPTTQLE